MDKTPCEGASGWGRPEGDGGVATAGPEGGDGGPAQAQRLQLDDLVTFEGAQTFHRQLGGVLQSHMSAITGEVRL